MPPAQQIYCFTVRPSPETYPEHEVEAIGSFTAVVPANRTLGEFLEDLSGEFSFETPDTAVNAKPVRILDGDSAIGGIGLTVGDDLFLSGFSDFVMRLDAIRHVDHSGPDTSSFDLSGFDADRMQEAAEDANADPDADSAAVEEPVYRVQFQTALAHEARGKSITLTRDMRWRGRLPLGLLATAAVEESDGLLDRATLVLSVLPTRSAEGWLNYPGPDYDGWKAMCVDELGVDPVPIPVADLSREVDREADPESYPFDADSDADDAVPDAGMEVRGWTVVVRPPEGGAVAGAVRIVVMSNGDYWKFRSLQPRSPS